MAGGRMDGRTDGRATYMMPKPPGKAQDVAVGRAAKADAARRGKQRHLVPQQLRADLLRGLLIYVGVRCALQSATKAPRPFSVLSKASANLLN